MKNFLITTIALLAFALTCNAQATNILPTNGPVGIGTVTPAGIFQVVTSGNTDFLVTGNTFDIGLGGATTGWARSFRVVNSSASNGTDGGAFGVTGTGTTPGYAYMAIPTSHLTGFNSTKILVLNNSGNVGISTTTPGSVLSLGVHGTTTVGNANMLRLYDNGTNSYGFGLNTSTGELATTVGSGGFQTFYTANTERMRIIQNGNVGIGTMSPDQKLTVGGTIHATSVVVDNQVTIPDYVFKSDYKLPILAEIKAYTDKNHHLPGIPAAAEMEKNGINLGEMNMALLKKVEELTLYLVEKDKEVKEQQSLNNRQKEENRIQNETNKQQAQQLALLQEQLNKLSLQVQSVIKNVEKH